MGKTIIKNYSSILNNLKLAIKQARLRSVLTVNTQLLQLYWQIGAVILRQQKKEGWGTKIIDRLAADLQSEFPDMQGLSVRNIKYMRAFAEAYPQFTIAQAPLAQIGKRKNTKSLIVQPSVAQLKQTAIVQAPLAQLTDSVFTQVPLAQLTWYHHITLLDKIKEPATRLFYIRKTIENGWSRNVMVHQIATKLHKRQGKTINNFKTTLPARDSDLINETFKNPYVFDFLSLTEKLQETDLEKALVANVKKLLLEMGKGFAFVGNQYNIAVGTKDRALDLLFYNFHLYRFVVAEIKIGEFAPEYAGKLNFYVNAVDDQVKSKNDNPTLGLLLCRTPDHTTIKYSLHGIKTPIGVSDYKLVEKLPKELKNEFPTIKEIEAGLEKEIPPLKRISAKRKKRK
jgi:predicted nuclease of restriction endonuclease-like (RecB) superfamily